MTMRRRHGIISIDDGPDDHTVWTDPFAEAVSDAAHCARYNTEELTQSQAFHLASCVDTFQYLLSTGVPMKIVIKRMGQLRKAVRELDEEGVKL